MNVWDIILGLIILAALFFALRRVIKTRKSGGCSCGSCSQCGKACGDRKKDK